MSVPFVPYQYCSCQGIPASFLTVELTGGGHIAVCYAIHLYCSAAEPVFQIKATDGSGVLTFDPSPQAFDIDGTTGVDTTCTMTISSFDAEGIVIEWRRSSDSSLIWKATNREHWNPAQRTPLQVIDYDPDAGIGFPGYACLVPLVGCALPVDVEDWPECTCPCEEPALYMFIVTVGDAGINTDAEAEADPEDVECLDEQCHALDGTYVIILGVDSDGGAILSCFGGCAEAGEYGECNGNAAGTGRVCLYASFGGTSTYFEVHGVAGSAKVDAPEGTFDNLIDVPWCDWVHGGGSTTLTALGWPHTICEARSVTITAVPLGSAGSPIGCDGEPIDVTRCPGRVPGCRGTSVWILRRGCELDGEYVYYWQLYTNGCAGYCGSGTGQCRPQPPFTIPETAIDDETAAAYSEGNLIEMLEVEQAGECECGMAAYVPPVCVCSGESEWTLTKRICGDGTLNQWYWVLSSSTCDGSCCEPKVPFSVRTDPITDAEATSLGYYDAMAASPIASSCSCADAYNDPEPCAACEGFCQYSIAGYTSANGSFGTLGGVLWYKVTDDGTCEGTVVGYVYLNIYDDSCSVCGCALGEKCITELGYWGVGGFPSNAGAVGNIGGSLDCES